jgi:CBS domain-containing protein
MTASEAIAFFAGPEKRHKSYPVLSDEGDLVAIVSRADVLRWQAGGGLQDKTLAELLGSKPIVVAYPDQILSEVADTMIEQDVGRVPVVQRGSQVIVGLLARKDLLRTRSHLSAAERDRTRYFAPSTSRANHIEASSAGK